MSSCPNCALLREIGGIFYENGNIDLEVLAVKSDFGGLFEVRAFSVSMEERRNNRTNDIEGDVANLENMVVRYLAKAVSIFPRDENAEKRKMSKDWQEIEKLNTNEENKLGLGQNLNNRRTE